MNYHYIHVFYCSLVWIYKASILEGHIMGLAHLSVYMSVWLFHKGSLQALTILIIIIIIIIIINTAVTAITIIITISVICYDTAPLQLLA